MASKVEELLQEINDVLEDTASSLNPSRHRDFIGLDDVLEQLISAAREEGAEQMRLKVITEAPGSEKDTFVSIPKTILEPIPTNEKEYEEMCKKVGLVFAPDKESES